MILALTIIEFGLVLNLEQSHHKARRRLEQRSDLIAFAQHVAVLDSRHVAEEILATVSRLDEAKSTLVPSAGSPLQFSAFATAGIVTAAVTTTAAAAATTAIAATHGNRYQIINMNKA